MPKFLLYTVSAEACFCTDSEAHACAAFFEVFALLLLIKSSLHINLSLHTNLIQQKALAELFSYECAVICREETIHTCFA